MANIPKPTKDKFKKDKPFVDCYVPSEDKHYPWNYCKWRADNSNGELVFIKHKGKSYLVTKAELPELIKD